MKRTKIKDRKLPDYTKGEEIFNMVSHIVGGGIGVAATVFYFTSYLFKLILCYHFMFSIW